jgi:rRNA maturation RNase YbeY
MILNQQKTVRLPMRMLRAFLQKIQRELKIDAEQVSIAFVEDAEIAHWNALYRNKTGPTDVLSFPATSHSRKKANGRSKPAPATIGKPHENFLGDIAIAPETARRYAMKNGRTLEKELQVLMLHGLLHLLGYDHECDRGEMSRIEQRLRSRLGIA